MFTSRYHSNEEGITFVDPNGFKPILKFPFSLILMQLTELLLQDGIKDILDHWCMRNCRPGQFVDIINNNVRKTLKAHDDTLFCDNDAARSNSDEL